MKVVSQQAEAFVRACLCQTHPLLIPAVPGRNPGLDNLRTQLQQRFAGGCPRVDVRDDDGLDDAWFDVDVVWTDGPSVEAVMGYCTSFSTVRTGLDGAPLVVRPNAWRRTFGTIGQPVARRSLTKQSTLGLLEYLAGKMGKPFALMAPFVVGGEEPVAENRHMEETVDFGARRLPAGEVLRMAVASVSWEGQHGAIGSTQKRRARR